MPDSASTIHLVLDANTAKFMANVKTAADRWAKDNKRMRSQAKRTSRGVNTAFNKIKFAAIGLAGALGVRELKQYADTWQQAENLLKTVVQTTEELARIQERVTQTAIDTRTSFEGTAQLYSRLARSARDLAITEDELFKITETVNKSIALSGATAQEARNGIIQFAQGMASSRLAGDELRAVLEQLPRLAIAIADGMDVGIGKLRELGKQGALTTPVVIEALRKQIPQIEKEFESFIPTVEQTFENLKTQLIVSVGDPLSKFLQPTFKLLSDEVVDLVQTIASLDTAWEIAGAVIINVIDAIVFAVDSFEIALLVIERILGEIEARFRELRGEEAMENQIDQAVRLTGQIRALEEMLKTGKDTFGKFLPAGAFASLTAELEDLRQQFGQLPPEAQKLAELAGQMKNVGRETSETTDAINATAASLTKATGDRVRYAKSLQDEVAHGQALRTQYREQKEELNSLGDEINQIARDIKEAGGGELSLDFDLASALAGIDTTAVDQIAAAFDKVLEPLARLGTAPGAIQLTNKLKVLKQEIIATATEANKNLVVLNREKALRVQLGSGYDNLAGQIETTTASYHQQTQAINTLEEQASQLKFEISELSKEHAFNISADQSIDEIFTLIQQIKGVETQIKKISPAMVKSAEELEKLTTKQKEIGEGNVELDASVLRVTKRYEEQRAEYDTLKAKADGLRKSIDAATGTRNFDIDSGDALRELEGMRTELNGVEGEIRSLQPAALEVGAVLKSLKERQADLGSSSVTQGINLVTENYNTQIAKIGELIGETNRLSSELKQVSGVEGTDISTNLGDSGPELAEMIVRHTELTNRVMELGSAAGQVRAEIDLSRERMQSYSAGMQTAEHDVIELTDQFKEESIAVGQLGGQMGELQTQVDRVTGKKEFDINAAETETELGALRRTLDELDVEIAKKFAEIGPGKFRNALEQMLADNAAARKKLSAIPETVQAAPTDFAALAKQNLEATLDANEKIKSAQFAITRELADIAVSGKLREITKTKELQAQEVEGLLELERIRQQNEAERKGVPLQFKEQEERLKIEQDVFQKHYGQLEKLRSDYLKGGAISIGASRSLIVAEAARETEALIEEFETRRDRELEIQNEIADSIVEGRIEAGERLAELAEEQAAEQVTREFEARIAAKEAAGELTDDDRVKLEIERDKKQFELQLKLLQQYLAKRDALIKGSQFKSKLLTKVTAKFEGTTWGKTYKGIISNLEEYGRVNEKVGRAVFLFKQAVAAADIVVSTATAIAEALPNYPLAAAVAITGALQLATVVATTIGGASSSSGVGSAPSSTPEVEDIEPADEPEGRASVEVHFHGAVIGDDDTAKQWITDVLAEAVEDRDLVIISGGSRQAQEIREG